MNSETPRAIDFERALLLLRRRVPVVLACVLIAAGSAFGFAKQQTKKYTATASLLFSPNSLGAIASGLGGGSGPPTQSEQDTNVELVGLGDVPSKTAKLLGPPWSGPAVAGALSISASSDTSIVEVAATARTPALAQTIANTYIKVFVTEQHQQTTSAIASAQSLVRKQLSALSHAQQVGPQGLALADRAQSLAILAKLDSGDVSVAGLASLPGSPSSPRVTRDTALGAILGLLIGVGLAFVLERLDRRIRDPKEFAAIYKLPLLAAVPDRKDYRILTSVGRSSAYDEVFNLLRSYLRYFAVNRDLRKLLVISAGPAEGKTTVSFNIAKAAATLGSSVLLIEADLRHGTLIDSLHGQPEPGLADVLIGDVTTQQAIRPLQVAPNGVLDVLTVGKTPPPNAAELIESKAMESLLREVGRRYDLVVIDTPPLSLVADAIPLLTKVDGVIVVGRMRKSRQDVAEQLRDRLGALGAPVLGVVANRVRGIEATGYGSRHRYGYYKAAPIVSVEEAATSNGSAPVAGVGTPADVE